MNAIKSAVIAFVNRARAAFSPIVQEQNNEYWFIAAQEGNVQVIRSLLEKGADINAKDNKGMTALDIAKDKGYVKLIYLLENEVIK